MKTDITACTLAASLWLLAAASAPAFFDPTIGRWASRDPVGEKGGSNLYGFTENSPISSIDLFGLWASILGEHDALTHASFGAALRSDPLRRLDSRCSLKILKALQGANNDQDKSTAFSENQRHYNRDYARKETPAQQKAGRAVWRKKYGDYIASEVGQFDSQLKQPKSGCQLALQALGRLSHSWQDFFAHAINAQSGWSNGPNAFPVTPASQGDYWPSSYGSWWAEHPKDDEPPYSSPERQRRWEAATAYVRDQYVQQLSRWVEQCQCEYCK
jgi:hypothetical protein